MTDATNSRLAGAFLLLLGLGLTAWMEFLVRNEGRYYVSAAFVGPAVAVAGLGFLTHAPKLPIRSFDTLNEIYSLLALAAGALNLHRYGAFARGSSTRTPLLIGLALVAVFTLQGWYRSRRRD